MTLSHEAAKALLLERHRTVTEQLGISARSAQEYLDDATLDALAEDLVATFADEEPGGDLFALPRTAYISVSSFGRLISALAETVLFFETHPMPEADRRARIHEIAQLLSLTG